MKRSVVGRGGTLVAAFAVAVVLTGCQDLSPTDLPVGLQAQAAKGGGKGSGKPSGSQPDLVVADLAGGMDASAQDVTLSESKNNMEIVGVRPGDCTDPADPDCFWTAIDLAAGIGPDASACTPSSGMSPAYAQELFDALTDAAQARWSFEADISKRHGTAFWRTFWFEDGNPDRFDLLHDIDSATKTSADGVNPEVWSMASGTVEITHGNDGLAPLSCPWTGSITLTITR